MRSNSVVPVAAVKRGRLKLRGGELGVADLDPGRVTRDSNSRGRLGGQIEVWVEAVPTKSPTSVAVASHPTGVTVDRKSVV